MKLYIKNWRCFTDTVLELHPEVTVLVGDTGAGKTSVLDAMARSNSKHVYFMDDRVACGMGAWVGNVDVPHVVATAVATCVGVSNPNVFQGERMRKFSQLSAGYQSIVGLVSELVRLEQYRGRVLIDDLELHLHPTLQRRILGDLRRTFPLVKWVITTSSPQILASAHRDWVRVIGRDGTIVPLPGFVEGRDSNAILCDVLGDRERPEEAEHALLQLYRLIDEGKAEEAQQLLRELEEKLGQDDTEMVKVRWQIQFRELRKV